MAYKNSKKALYINPYTDFGFKKLFGEEANKDLLIDFLNLFLPDYHKVKDIQFFNPENIGEFSADRKAIFDIHDEAENGAYYGQDTKNNKEKFY